MARRDLRSGQQTAQAMLDAEGVRLSITWGKPNSGVFLHCFRLLCIPPPSTIYVFICQGSSAGEQILATTKTCSHLHCSLLLCSAR